jgi:hypothetical protein
MSETISVSPTPIQRNSADVALELTELYFKRYGLDSMQDITDAYSKFYATAEYLRMNHRKLENLVPEDIIRAISK